MNALSRREEDTLMKATKAHALKECDPLVKQFAECATGRTVSVAWACKSKYKEVQDCISQFTGPENMKVVREEYLRLRDQRKQDTPAAVKPS